MAKVVRLIWRLDFDINYDFLDKRGTALKIMNETEEDFFNQVTEGNIINSFVGEHRFNNGYRMMSIEPTSISGSIEWNVGIDINLALSSEHFRGSDKICNALCKCIGLRKLRRAGIRTIGVGSKSQSVEGLSSPVGWINQNLGDKNNQILGEIIDVGLVLEGQTPDGLFYRNNFGPLALRNVDMHLSSPKTDDRDKIYNKFDLFFDIDVYENNFSFLAGSLYRWARTKFDKTHNFINSISFSTTG